METASELVGLFKRFEMILSGCLLGRYIRMSYLQKTGVGGSGGTFWHPSNCPLHMTPCCLCDPGWRKHEVWSRIWEKTFFWQKPNFLSWVAYVDYVDIGQVTDQDFAACKCPSCRRLTSISLLSSHISLEFSKKKF